MEFQDCTARHSGDSEGISKTVGWFLHVCFKLKRNDLEKKKITMSRKIYLKKRAKILD